MKLKGKILDGPRTSTVVIPRDDGDLVFTAQAVLDFADFDKLNPVPKPPTVMRPGGISTENVEDPKYVGKLTEWAESKTHWMVLRSLEATEELEWDTVKADDPSTWSNYQEEMQNAGFSALEIGRIVMCVTDACGLNQQKIDEATQRFLAGRAKEPANGLSPSSVQSTTPSGVRASVSG